MVFLWSTRFSVKINYKKGIPCKFKLPVSTEESLIKKMSTENKKIALNL